MAATNFTPISLYYTTTVSAAPTAGNLVNGELAINITDGKLYYKDNAGVVQTIAGKGGAGVAGGSNTQVQYNSSGSLAGSANMTFNGTTLTLANDASISGLTVGKGTGGVSSNAVLGLNAMQGSNSGTGQNVAIGNGALNANTTGAWGVGVGSLSLLSNTTGSFNVSVGGGALQSNTTASQNTAVGYQAAYANTTGSITAFGYQAGLANTTGADITALGFWAVKSNTTGTANVGVGGYALQNTSTGISNTALGYTSLQANTTGSSNVALGYQTLIQNTTASYNTAVGYQAGYSQTTAEYNTFIGYYAGRSTTGGQNTFLGKFAGNAVTTGTANTIIGAYNGNQEGLDIRTASNYIVLSDGGGSPRGIFDSTGRFLVGTASNAQSSKVKIDGGSDFSLETFRSGTGTSTQVIFTNSNGIVGQIQTSGSATLYLTTSDYRLKNVFGYVSDAGQRIDALEPIEYEFKAGGRTKGFLAHKFAEVYPNSVSGEKDAVDKDGKPVYQAMQASSSEVMADLIAEIQSLRKRVALLESK
jgi:hypothetical protein